MLCLSRGGPRANAAFPALVQLSRDAPFTSPSAGRLGLGLWPPRAELGPILSLKLIGSADGSKFQCSASNARSGLPYKSLGSIFDEPLNFFSRLHLVKHSERYDSVWGVGLG